MRISSNIFRLIVFSILLFGNVKAQTKKDSATIQYLDTISHYLDSLGVQEKQYVLAQAIWETGWFKCKNCAWSKGYNLFGFRSKSGYIKYNSWQESVIAYSEWQKKRYPKYKKSHTNGNYLNFLKWCRYAETDAYSKHVTYVYNWLGKNYIK
jgi:flagellum-specific peptidoglycan hydrolase FlgJ